ncbi:MAG: PaeR7I family type II restriction endonuclease [Acetobacteraceae bacterium]
MIDVDAAVRQAVRAFWRTRAAQSRRQGGESGRRDRGGRRAVTAGHHADGFAALAAEIVRDAGLDAASIRWDGKRARTLPGYFRTSKEWDLLVIHGEELVAAIEVKSHVGSFGNNFNNRVEEALGSALDCATAWKHGRFAPSPRPWLGYMLMVEAHPESTAPTRPMQLQPFPADPAFQGLSYLDRYRQLGLRLLREGLYDAVCLIASAADAGRTGAYQEPDPELGVRAFATLLHARAGAFARIGPSPAR